MTTHHSSSEASRVEEALGQLPPELFEQTYVHSVYNEIAGHFSDTRYKPWPAVESFLKSLDPGSLGVDIGCGNGKYLGVNKENVWMIGCDRSDQLIRICGSRGHQAFVSDALSVPIRSHSMDFAISIAVIHHLSTPSRRLEAVKESLRVVKPGGLVFIQVWALEQQGKRTFTEQDNFVSWNLPTARYGKEKEPGNVVYQRFYHLFKKGELDELVVGCGGTIIESDFEKDNHFVICRVIPNTS